MSFNWKKCTIGALLACMPMVMVGCGDDNNAAPTGKIVKGLVSGEQVTDDNGVVVTVSTGTDGKFTMSGKAPYRTAGKGKYTSLNANGTAGATLPAPVMIAPEGASVISPLSTLVANDTTGTILAKLKALGIDLNTDLSVVTAANKNAVILNEAVGAVLQATGGINTDVIKALVANVLTLDTTTPANINAASIIGAVIAGDLAGYNTAVTTAANGASALKDGPLPTPPAPPTPTPGSSLDITASGSVRP